MVNNPSLNFLPRKRQLFSKNEKELGNLLIIYLYNVHFEVIHTFVVEYKIRYEALIVFNEYVDGLSEN